MRDFLAFPTTVKEDMDNALGIPQFGGTAPTARPWKGLGPGVLESWSRTTGTRIELRTPSGSRKLCAPRVPEEVSSGIRTAKRDVDLVGERLKTAERDYEGHYGKPKR